jgi:hypothetical protein
MTIKIDLHYEHEAMSNAEFGENVTAMAKAIADLIDTQRPVKTKVLVNALLLLAANMIGKLGKEDKFDELMEISLEFLRMNILYSRREMRKRQGGEDQRPNPWA